MLETLTADSFMPHLDTGFSVTVAGYSDVLTLIEVVRSRYAVPEGQRAPFTLIFRGGRADIRFEPQIMALGHPAMGTLEIDVVPLARLPDGRFEYQAGFN